jgi:CHRD domain
MRKIAVVPFALVAGAGILGGQAIAAGATKVITVKMSGKQEVPKGSPTGSGSATITLKRATGKVCYRLSWSKIGAPIAAHIHKGPKGKAGPVVVALFGNPPAKHSGCVTAKKPLIAAIEATPGAYYVNVHTKTYGGGAIRGQL